jgi:hypothetical protein
MKKIFTLIALTALITTAANAQNNDFSSLFKSGPGDATKLAQAYLEPFFKGFGNSMSGGWTNTAKTKKLLHFDLRVSASGTMVPTADQSFDYSKIGLSSAVGPKTVGQSTVTPTFGGNSNTAGAPISIYSTDGSHTKLADFTLPSGVYNIVPAPQIQLTVGLIKNTDVTLRYMPTINSSSFGSNSGSNNFSIDMIGFGIKHNIIQDFGSAKHVMPFDLAIAVGYTKLTYNYGLTVNPQTDPNGKTAKPKDASQSTDFSNQNLSGKFSNINIQAILSKKLLFFTPIISAGYTSCSTTIGTYGNYPITTGVDGPITQNPVYTTYNNPVVINETSLSGLHADVGFQLNILILNIYGSYSAGQYSSFNGGIGLGF